MSSIIYREILYHGMRTEPVGDFLNPGFEREINGEIGNYLFATPYLSKVMQFAFDWHSGEAIIGGAIPEEKDQYVVICEREKTLLKDPYLRVYYFGMEGFEKAVSGSPYLGKVTDTREYIRRTPLPFAETNFFEITLFEELMENRLQVFSSEKTAQQLREEGFLKHRDFTEGNAQWLHFLVNNPELCWENKKIDLCMSPTLRKMLT